MTNEELQKLKLMVRELNKMQDIIKKVDDKIFNIAMKIWKMTMDRGVK